MNSSVVLLLMFMSVLSYKPVFSGGMVIGLICSVFVRTLNSSVLHLTSTVVTRDYMVY